jgi:hypothetical protein
MYFVFKKENEFQSQAGGCLRSFRSLVRQPPNTRRKALDNVPRTLYPCQADVGDLSSAELFLGNPFLLCTESNSP